KETAIHSILLKLLSAYACIHVASYAAIFAIVPIFGWLGAAAIIFYLGSIMAMTGTIQLCSVICLFREKKLNLLSSIICAFLGYCIIADIITAVFLIYKSGKTAAYYSINA
ncbi:MAG: hypothetical protein K6B41_09110, partial [Butyrivibrio sp.]|nr:hypothetical protein [Butyrivibrio sp.]